METIAKGFGLLIFFCFLLFVGLVYGAALLIPMIVVIVLALVICLIAFLPVVLIVGIPMGILCLIIYKFLSWLF